MLKKFFFYFLKLFLTIETCLRDSALGLHAYEDRFFPTCLSQHFVNLHSIKDCD